MDNPVKPAPAGESSRTHADDELLNLPMTPMTPMRVGPSMPFRVQQLGVDPKGRFVKLTPSTGW